MSQLINNHPTHDVLLDFKLINNESFIYKKDVEDYLNWIPVDFKLCVGEDIYIFKKKPTFSLDGLKIFIQTIESLLEKKAEMDRSGIYEHYKPFECGATEGEFWLNMKLPSNKLDAEHIFIEIWLNVIYLKELSAGYEQGFSFTVFSEDLVKFVKELKQQLYELTDGNEGEK